MIRPTSPQDRIMRVTFAPVGPRGRGIALAIGGVAGGMIRILNNGQLDQFRAEPICVSDGFVVPSFRSDGNALVTLSGAFWQSMDTIRVWDLALRKPAVDISNLRFTGKSAPPWLSEIADAVAGVRALADDNETPVLTLSELKKKYAGTTGAERVHSDLGSLSRHRRSMSSRSRGVKVAPCEQGHGSTVTCKVDDMACGPPLVRAVMVNVPGFVARNAPLPSISRPFEVHVTLAERSTALNTSCR